MRHDITTSQPRSGAQTLLEISGATRPTLFHCRAVLLVIDAQQEYATGALALDGLEAALEAIEGLAQWARMSGVPVVNIRHEGSPEAKVFGRGTPGVEFLPRVAPMGNDFIVTKTLPNAFARTELQDLVTSMDRDQLILTGFMTHMCLDSTARAASELGYTNFIVASATADRALPDLNGGTIPSATVVSAHLAGLADRFGWIFADVGELFAGANLLP